MASGTRTFGLQESLAEPQVLLPPPVRHALLTCLVTLAAVLHFGTTGWSDIQNGPEGLYAASAKGMLASDNWLVPRINGTPLPNEPPLFQWLLLGSFQLFGTNAIAARLPVAAAFVACVALTFLIGERLAGYWRGFVGGLIYLCLCGSSIWGRFVTPEPLFAACVAAAILCALTGYQRRRGRRLWFTGFWACAAAAYLTRGAFALLLVAIILTVSAVSFREARLRFASLFHWSGLALFVFVLAPWAVFFERSYPGTLRHGVWIMPFSESDIAQLVSGMAAGEFIAAHLIWWFPILPLVLAALIFGWRNIVRPAEFGFADALPLCWTAAACLPLLVANRPEQDSIALWAGFALFSAWAWDRTTAPLRLAGITLVAVVGISTAWAIFAGQLVLPGAAHTAFQQGHGSILTLTVLALLVVCVAAAYLTYHEREKLAILTLLLGMVPIGLGAVETIARNASHTSFARAAHYLQTHLGESGEVVFEGPPEAGSSLAFYLDRGFSVVVDPQRASASAILREQLTDADTIERMAGPHPVYLIIHKDRVPSWQARLTERFHIYHQVTTCGSYVVLNNHP